MRTICSWRITRGRTEEARFFPAEWKTVSRSGGSVAGGEQIAVPVRGLRTCETPSLYFGLKSCIKEKEERAGDWLKTSLNFSPGGFMREREIGKEKDESNSFKSVEEVRG